MQSLMIILKLISMTAAVLNFRNTKNCQNTDLRPRLCCEKNNNEVKDYKLNIFYPQYPARVYRIRRALKYFKTYYGIKHYHALYSRNENRAESYRLRVWLITGQQCYYSVSVLSSYIFADTQIIVAKTFLYTIRRNVS